MYGEKAEALNALCLLFNEHKFMQKFIISWVLAVSVISGCDFSQNPAILWEFETSYSGGAFPVVDGKNVYVGSDKFYCLNAETGRLIWDFETFGTVSSQALVQDGYVYLQCGGLYCLNAETGQLVWEFWTGIWSDKKPAISEGYIYSMFKNRLYCLDAKTGKKIWDAASIKTRSWPIVSDGQVYVGGYGRIQCFDAEKGVNIRWLNIGRGWLHPAVSNGRVYAVTQDNRLYCIEAEGGKISWLYDFKGPVVEHLTVTDEYVYVIITDARVFCLDAKSGSLIWKTDFKDHQILLNYPILSGNYLYVRSAETEKIASDTGAFVNKRSPFRINCIDAGTGEKLWDSRMLSGRYAVAGDLLYCGPVNYRVYCLKAEGEN